MSKLKDFCQQIVQQLPDTQIKSKEVKPVVTENPDQKAVGKVPSKDIPQNTPPTPSR